jgi:Holliday junction resolvase-like predicted endonuclease
VELLTSLKTGIAGKPQPEHLRYGKLGERAAREHLQRQGLKFLTANFRTDRGEIDLVFRTVDCPPLSTSRHHPLARCFLRLFNPAARFSPLPLWLRLACTRDFRHGADCLVFVEVKTRSSEEWARPAAAVDRERRQRLTRTALDYLRLLRNPPVKLRFDIVEVLLENGAVHEIRHLPNAFPMEHPYRYG